MYTHMHMHKHKHPQTHAHKNTHTHHTHIRTQRHKHPPQALPHTYMCTHTLMLCVAGVPKALLGHKVAKEHIRPTLPLLMPQEYKELMIKCWDSKPENR